jgi:plastocyanin
MTFVTASAPDEPNPTLHFRAGERVRVVLRNEAPGLLHDFEIRAWNVRIEQLRAGETGEVTFTVPDRPGRDEYRCRPHAELMHGSVEVIR